MGKNGSIIRIKIRNNESKTASVKQRFFDSLFAILLEKDRISVVVCVSMSKMKKFFLAIDNTIIGILD